MSRYVLIFLVTFMISPVLAAPQKITVEMLENKFQMMTKVMNSKDSREKAIEFFHTHISENAQFDMSGDNHTNPDGNRKAEHVFDKARYINSYIMGTNMIDSYQMDIRISSINISDHGQQAISKEIITERGLMMNPFNFSEAGKPFIAITSCTTEHSLNDGIVVSTSANCHTSTSFENSI